MATSTLSRSRLAASALLRLLAGLVVVPALLILPAGTLSFWEAWTYLAITLIPLTMTAAYLLLADPELMERRMRTRDEDPQQVVIVVLAGVCFVAVLLVAGFDRRFGWSRVPGAAVVIGDLIIVAAYALFLIVLRENRSASRVIEVVPGQRVVASGPYAIVRHPMYTAVAVMGLATAVALGSWWAVVPALGLVPILVARIRREEQTLITGLAGYAEYMRTTVYRLIPGLW